MNVMEAINSGKKFRRLSWPPFTHKEDKNCWERHVDDFGFTLLNSDILAADWEVQLCEKHDSATNQARPMTCWECDDEAGRPWGSTLKKETEEKPWKTLQEVAEEVMKLKGCSDVESCFPFEIEYQTEALPEFKQMLPENTYLIVGKVVGKVVETWGGANANNWAGVDAAFKLADPCMWSVEDDPVIVVGSGMFLCDGSPLPKEYQTGINKCIEVLNTKHICTCDYHKVTKIIGCQCGGV